MALTNIEYNNLYTRNILNKDSLLDILNNIEFTEKDDKLLKFVSDIDNDPLRYKILHIEKDIILKFIYDNEHTLNYKIIRKIKRLVNVIARCNDISFTNRELVGRIKNIVIGYKIY